MKPLLLKIKSKVIAFCKWIWSEVKDWHNLVLLLIVAAAFLVLCIIAVTLALIFIDGKIHIIYAVGVVIAFWVGPFTPFWPICIAVTLFISRFLKKFFAKKKYNK